MVVVLNTYRSHIKHEGLEVSQKLHNKFHRSNQLRTSIKLYLQFEWESFIFEFFLTLKPQPSESLCFFIFTSKELRVFDSYRRKSGDVNNKESNSKGKKEIMSRLWRIKFGFLHFFYFFSSNCIDFFNVVDDD